MKRAATIAAAAVLLVFAPNFPHLFDGVLGATGSDAFKHVWSQWFVVHQLQDQGGLSLQTDLVNHPSGGSFFSLDTVNALIGLPLRTFLDAVPTYNVVLLLNLMAAAVGGAWLCGLVTQDTWSRATAGFGFACSTWVLAFPVASGVSETAVFWPVPIIVWLGHKTWHASDWKWPVLTGLLLTFQGAACWSHGITAGLLLMGMFLFAIMKNPRSWKQDDRVKRIAVLLCAALLLAIPGYLAVSGTVSSADAIKTRTLSLFHSAPIGPLDALETNNMALVDFVALGSWGLRTASAGTERLMYAANPGLLLLGCAWLGWRARGPSAKLLATGGLLMLFMSLGPRIYFDHARTMGGIPNPIYLFAYWCIPLVNATIHSVDRFAVGTQLCLALLAGMGVSQLKARWRPWVLLALIVELTAASAGPWPTPMAKAERHPASIRIGAHSNTGAVLDIPFMEGDTQNRWFLGDIFLQQTVHHRPIPFQLEGNGLETVNPAVRANVFFKKLAAGAMQNLPLAPGCGGVEALAEMGFGWVVWRTNLTPRERHAEFRTLLEACLTNAGEYDDRLVFEIQPPG